MWKKFAMALTVFAIVLVAAVCEERWIQRGWSTGVGIVFFRNGSWSLRNVLLARSS